MLVVKDAIRMQQHIAQNAGHIIELDAQVDDRIPLYGDYGRLLQMLVTVLDNAIKFSASREPIRMLVNIDLNICTITISNRGNRYPSKGSASYI